ncbi:hypothetical protein OC835_002954 [Tilletia horrida]|nr:hypothetical protein OC835_002954 [Tilletia horrida]
MLGPLTLLAATAASASVASGSLFHARSAPDASGYTHIAEVPSRVMSTRTVNGRQVFTRHHGEPAKPSFSAAASQMGHGGEPKLGGGTANFADTYTSTSHSERGAEEGHEIVYLSPAELARFLGDSAAGRSAAESKVGKNVPASGNPQHQQHPKRALLQDFLQTRDDGFDSVDPLMRRWDEAGLGYLLHGRDDGSATTMAGVSTQDDASMTTTTESKPSLASTSAFGTTASNSGIGAGAGAASMASGSSSKQVYLPVTVSPDGKVALDVPTLLQLLSGASASAATSNNPASLKTGSPLSTPPMGTTSSGADDTTSAAMTKMAQRDLPNFRMQPMPPRSQGPYQLRRSSPSSSPSSSASVPSSASSKDGGLKEKIQANKADGGGPKKSGAASSAAGSVSWAMLAAAVGLGAMTLL